MRMADLLRGDSLPGYAVADTDLLSRGALGAAADSISGERA
jgi:hypothetical protein